MLPQLLLLAATHSSLEGTTILVTAPPAYASRLQRVLKSRGSSVVTCPTVQTELLRRRDQGQLRRDLLRECDFVAFTSRRGIEAAVRACGPRLCRQFRRGDSIPIALGADAEALVARGVPRDCILVPRRSTPAGIISMLRATVPRRQRRATTVLCPVPLVVDLSEPPVVPRFVYGLRRAGFDCARFPAYLTRWPGKSRSARRSVRMLADGRVDAIALTSTAEAEGLLRYCDEYSIALPSNADVPVVAHGRVTAGGARACGMRVAAFNRRPASFAGLADAIEAVLRRRRNGEWILEMVEESWLLD